MATKSKSVKSKSVAVKSEDLTIVNPPVASSAQVAEPQTDTHIGQAQVFCMMVLTGEVKELIASGASTIETEQVAKRKGANIVQKIADMMYANGATYRNLGTKRPTGETGEDEIIRVEFTRQVREIIESRLNQTVQDAINVDVVGIVRDWNKKRKAEGKSSMTAVEIEEAGGIPEGTMLYRKFASDTVSQYLKRIVAALKKLEPEEDAPEKSTGTESAGETEEAVSEKTDYQRFIEDLQKAVSHGQKTDQVATHWITAINMILSEALGTQVE